MPPADVGPAGTPPGPWHPTDDDFDRLIDGELEAGDERRLREHLDRCQACAARHRGARLADRRITERLEVLDHEAPDVDPDALIARAGGRGRGGGSARASAIASRSGTRPRAGLVAAAAATLLVALGAAAAVIPGFPGRGVLERVLGDTPGPTPPSSAARPETAAEPPPASGISFVPEPDLEVVFLRSQSDGAIRISLAETPEVRVRALGGRAAYDLDLGSLVVDNAGSGASYEIRLPRSLRRVRVRVGDRSVFEKVGASVSGAAVERDGTYVVPFDAGADGTPGSGETGGRSSDGRGALPEEES